LRSSLVSRGGLAFSSRQSHTEYFLRGASVDDRIHSYAESLLARADAANVPSGILYWPISDPYRIESFDGDEWRGECDQDLWRRLYAELHYGVKRDGGMLSLAQLDERLGEWHERGEVPVAIAYYGYDMPKRTFVGAVSSPPDERASRFRSRTRRSRSWKARERSSPVRSCRCARTFSTCCRSSIPGRKFTSSFPDRCS
jgi:hypothetical protein